MVGDTWQLARALASLRRGVWQGRTLVLVADSHFDGVDRVGQLLANYTGSQVVAATRLVWATGGWVLVSASAALYAGPGGGGLNLAPAAPADGRFLLRAPRRPGHRPVTRVLGATVPPGSPPPVWLGEQVTVLPAVNRTTPAEHPTSGLPRVELSEDARLLWQDSQPTPYGRSFYGRPPLRPVDRPAALAATRGPALPPNAYVLDIRAGVDGFWVGEQRMTPKELAGIVAADPQWTGQPIVLTAGNAFDNSRLDNAGLDSSAPDGGVFLPLPQLLADALQALAPQWPVRVIGASGQVWTGTDGRRYPVSMYAYATEPTPGSGPAAAWYTPTGEQRQALAALGRRPTGTDPDGNSFFVALGRTAPVVVAGVLAADTSAGRPYPFTVQGMRDFMADFLLADVPGNPGRYAPFGITAQTVAPLAARLRRDLEWDRAWGDWPAMVAGLAFGLNVTVVLPDGGTSEAAPRSGERVYLVGVDYPRGHYLGTAPAAGGGLFDTELTRPRTLRSAAATEREEGAQRLRAAVLVARSTSSTPPPLRAAPTDGRLLAWLRRMVDEGLYTEEFESALAAHAGPNLVGFDPRPEPEFLTGVDLGGLTAGQVAPLLRWIDLAGPRPEPGGWPGWLAGQGLAPVSSSARDDARRGAAARRAGAVRVVDRRATGPVRGSRPHAPGAARGG